ncbi:ribokinase [Gracilibacillus oryzae]|uniref:Ribokinase n=1 Tax=Gracilibacillus oryzae TaxID=1672701 RepID=A0A7C8KSV1_9BACI|nr:ribokinase [Gracilibacillus oryzae]KAB8129896.1 ribokinase [Gracilibacillus oryzae]
MKKPKITVIGSINMDLVTSTEIFPEKGETVRGTTFETQPGGKGANQAVAAARLGADVQMIGCVGDDAFGEELLTVLQKEKINVDSVSTIPETSSGLANIILTEKDNRIIFISGANEHVTPAFVSTHKEQILDSEIVVIQFEIPKETIEYCLAMCSENNIPVIVNPAPAMQLSDEAWEKATYITPNESERAQLFGDEYEEKMMITKGEAGVEFIEAGIKTNIPGHQVEVLDTTGAGDTFNGALAAQLAQGSSLREALTFANAAAALSVQKLGAQSGMPTAEEVDQFLKKG